VEGLYRFYIVAGRKTRDEFIAHHPGLYLVKPPAEVLSDDDDDDDDEGPTRLTAWAETDTAALRDPRALAGEWLVDRLHKRADYPPFNRITVGRSRVNDLVLPSGAVSKQHAWFHVSAGEVTHLSDRGSANGTLVRGRRLARDEIVPVAPGDEIYFGSLATRLLSPGMLYDLLRAR
jgi:hypothetical protein